MDKIETQNAIGITLQNEVAELERIVFGCPQGGWPVTGLNIQQLRDRAIECIELKRLKNLRGD